MQIGGDLNYELVIENGRIGELVTGYWSLVTDHWSLAPGRLGLILLASNLKPLT